MRRRGWTGLLCAFALVAILGQDDCESPQSVPEQRFCAGESRGVIDQTVRDIRGQWNVIIGGFEASEPFATVQVVISGKGYCTGTVIAPHVVLTAGHCKGDAGYKVYQDIVHHPDEYRMPIREVRHPGYARWSNERTEPHDDLMLLFFDSPLPSRPVDGLYDSTAMWRTCESTFGQGWGQTKRSDAPPPEGFEYIPCEDGSVHCLQETPLYVQREQVTDIDTVVPGWGGICFGDSGGPLYARFEDGSLYLAGVTSTTSAANCVGYDWGDGFNQAHGTHVKVGFYIPWILDEMKKFYAAHG